MLRFLYETAAGRCVLKPLTMPCVSKLSGSILDSSLSTMIIPSFAKHNHIRLSDYQDEKYGSFNDFFCRRIRPEKRPVNQDPDVLIAPCDGLLSIYPIQDDLVVPVKSSRYSISDLLRSKKLAKKYDGGTCLVFRLCVDHYHRYAYVETGHKTKNVHIDGILHTVRPIALREIPVFTENSREYTMIHTENFGDIIQMEVGAMLVGRIKNHMGAGDVIRGQEKGCFQYGGSTIILLLEKDKARFSKKLYAATDSGMEIPVKFGQKISLTK